MLASVITLLKSHDEPTLPQALSTGMDTALGDTSTNGLPDEDK